MASIFTVIDVDEMPSASAIPRTDGLVISIESDEHDDDELQLISSVIASSSTSANSQPPSSHVQPTALSNPCTESAQYECLICLDTFTSALTFHGSACEHRTCKECTVTYLSDPQHYPIRCVHESCTAPLDDTACLELLRSDSSAESYLALEKFIIERKLLENVTYCSNGTCATPIALEDVAETVVCIKCPMCKASTCRKCKCPWHDAMTCEQFQATVASKEFSQLSKKLCIKRCPKCGHAVEKSSGCNRVTCKCGTVFCFKCGKQSQMQGRSFYGRNGAATVLSCGCDVYAPVGQSSK